MIHSFGFKRMAAAVLALVCIGQAAVFAAPSAETETAAETQTAAVGSERVEIAFRVGDDTLSINGEDVKVETPYVVGVGVTLVPVRVITEAFGAEVDWEESTQSVFLEYPDVSIVLQIGNPVAEVNGKATALLAAPELTEAGFTMVPLRFISENFGAEVSYDEETERILVVKEAVDEGALVTGGIEEPYVGDSYYGWMIETPKDMSMSYRSFDGTTTRFGDSYGAYISIYVSLLDEDYDFEDEFKSLKKENADYATLLKAESNAESSPKTMHFQYRTGTYLYDERMYVTDTYLFEVYAGMALESEIRPTLLAELDTFRCEFAQGQTHDLSDLTEDGLRKFESEDMNFTLYLPADFYSGSSYGKINEFSFYPNATDDTVTSLLLSIYSLSELEDVPLDESMKRSRDIYLLPMNRDLVSATAVAKKEYADFTAYEFELTVDGSVARDGYARILWFEKGDYVYTLSVYVKEGTEDPENFVDTLLNKMQFGTIDSEKIGLLLAPDSEYTDETEETVFGCFTFDRFTRFEDALGSSSNTTVAMYYSEVDSALITAVAIASQPGVSQTDTLNALKTQMALSGSEILEEPSLYREGNIPFYRMTLSKVEDDNKVYTVVYTCVQNDVFYMFTFSYDELYYSAYNRTAAEDMIKSVRMS